MGVAGAHPSYGSDENICLGLWWSGYFFDNTDKPSQEDNGVGLSSSTFQFQDFERGAGSDVRVRQPNLVDNGAGSGDSEALGVESLESTASPRSDESGVGLFDNSALGFESLESTLHPNLVESGVGLCDNTGAPIAVESGAGSAFGGAAALSGGLGGGGGVTGAGGGTIGL
jgi:hypothetical protein